MDDLISRQAAIEALGDMPMSWADTDAEIQAQEDWKQHREALLKLPTADLSEYCDKLWKTAYERGKAEARPKGKWENTGECEERGTVRYICSECGRDDWHFPLSKISYCWNCGARMEESE